MKNSSVIETTRRWVESFVVGLNLCPFAKRELLDDRVRFVVTDADDEELLLIALEAELNFLESDQSTETTLLIHPEALQNFPDYNQFLDLADALLVEMNHDGVYQVASFHPDYQFGGTEADDAENYTNRSPYPMLHILREESLERVIAGYPDIDQVPVRNVTLMNDMGKNKLESLLVSSADKSKR